MKLTKEMVEQWINVLNYFDSDVQDCAEREHKMSWYKRYEKTIDEIYNLFKEL